MGSAPAGVFWRRERLSATLFKGQEAEGEEDQGGVMVELAPGAAPEVIWGKFPLHLLLALIDLPALLPQAHRGQARGASGRVAERVFDGPIDLLLDE